MRASGALLDDVAWVCERPREDAIKIAGCLCFSHEGLEIEVDGERVE
jgi:uncharacterized protein (DUF427 family)